MLVSCRRCRLLTPHLTSENPRAHKNKIVTPPQKKPKLPPPKTRNFMGMEVFQQKERNFPGAHKIGTAISGPRIAGKHFYGHEDFSDHCFILDSNSTIQF